MDITWDFTLHLPADVDFLKTMSFVAVFTMAVLIICLAARIFLGKDSGLKSCIVTALGIVMLYAIAVLIYTFSPRDFTRYLNQLPIGSFTQMEDGQKVLVLNTFQALPFPALCRQLLRVLVLALTINALDGYTPPKVKGLGWFLWRIFSFCLAIFINFMIYWVAGEFLPFEDYPYPPMIILGILVFCLGMGIMDYILVLLLLEVNPVFIVLYGFFFNDKIGKRITRSVGATIIVYCFMRVVEALGYGFLKISPGNLSAYFPFALCMFLLWLLTSRKL